MMPLWLLMFLTPAGKMLLLDRIVGGNECIPHSRLWQVYLTYKEDFFCGGSHISARWIVSAAHCYMLPRYMVAHLGEHDVTIDVGTEQHYNYNSGNLDTDFMLIKLAESTQFNQYVQPIPVAKICPVEETQCMVSGYGNMDPS
ncbi:hypothetical protein GDO86_018658 [Hymenochirus boettgeri]|uniref:Peptidase S1 domain-containing protein n=1 Tax=Hymenochirus boettgeri TaxID=247094 RepID=A0A8T2IDR7_9PIPI|nr:hypothetical protein GDO86_018658 [Hymenochirus boettgeri]